MENSQDQSNQNSPLNSHLRARAEAELPRRTYPNLDRESIKLALYKAQCNMVGISGILENAGYDVHLELSPIQEIIKVVGDIVHDQNPQA